MKPVPVCSHARYLHRFAGYVSQNSSKQFMAKTMHGSMQLEAAGGRKEGRGNRVMLLADAAEVL